MINIPLGFMIFSYCVEFFLKEMFRLDYLDLKYIVVVYRLHAWSGEVEDRRRRELKMNLFTLDMMNKGGIHDHISQVQTMATSEGGGAPSFHFFFFFQENGNDTITKSKERFL